MGAPQHFEAGTYRRTLVSFGDALGAHAAAIDRLNVYPVPDGDTGTNMARTIEAVVAELSLAGEAMDDTCRAVSHASLMGARGNSGVILSQMLRGLSGVLAGRAEHDGRSVADGLLAAAAAAYAAVLRPVEGTILTVAREAANAAERAAQRDAGLVGVLDAAHAAGRDALVRTPELLPVLKAAGVVDAGGAGFMLLLDAALHVVDGRPLPEPPETAPATAAVEAPATASGPRFEVMYLLELADGAIGEFKEAWGALGDSIVVTGGDGLWNCHVHTDDIGGAVEVALDLGGRPRDIRVTDLYAGGRHEAEPTAASAETTRTAVVAVASGPGLAALFGELGVAATVAGGQTTNPSTAELLAAVEAVPAAEVVLLPNNANVVPVARQVQHVTAKRVHVVPTRSMTEGLAALVAFDPAASGGDNERAMAVAAGGVGSGEVTRAVRAADGPAGPIAVGDWLAIVDGDVVATRADLASAAVAVLERLVGPECELVTLVEGDGATAATTSALTSWVTEHHPAVEVEVHRGGQPHYPYLFGAE